MQKIIIVGNTIYADIMYSYLKQDGHYSVEAFAVDQEYTNENVKFDLPVVDLENLRNIYSQEDYHVIIGVGYTNMNKNREKIFGRIKGMGYVVERYIHPDAKIFNNYDIGEGSIVLANTVVEPYAVIRANSIVWTNCTVGHHSIVEENCWIASGTIIAGQATIKRNCFLGVNVTVANKAVVNEFNLIGAHTIIQKNTDADAVYLSHNGEKLRYSALEYAKYFLL